MNQDQRMDSKHKLGLWTTTSLVIGNIIGAGIFLLPVSLAPYGFFNSLAAWAFTATGALLLAMVYSALSRGIPEANGPYEYIRRAFGELPAFLILWSYWVGVWVGNASIVTGMTSYLAGLVPAIDATPGLAPTLCIVTVWLLTIVNILGTRKAGAVQAITTVMKLLPLLLVIVVGVLVFFAQPARMVPALQSAPPLAIGSIIAAATMTLWPLMGFESANVASERVNDPQRTIPRATMIGTLIAAVVYVLAGGAIQALIPPEILSASTAPFADAVRLVLGDGIAVWVALFAAISAFGALNGWILVTGELPYQLAKAGVFPAFLARESRYRTPATGLLASSLLLTAILATNYQKSMVQLFQYALLISTASIIVLYLFSALAAWVLARRGEMRFPATQLAWLRVVSVLAALYSLCILVGAGLTLNPGICAGASVCWTPWRDNAVYMGALLLLLGLPVYFWMKRARARGSA
jgi:APA family basic amino acid/polyamine antiporter